MQRYLEWQAQNPKEKEKPEFIVEAGKAPQTYDGEDFFFEDAFLNLFSNINIFVCKFLVRMYGCTVFSLATLTVIRHTDHH